MRIAGGVTAGAILIVLLAWMEWLAQGGGAIPAPPMRTITAEQAQSAALAAVPGIVEGMLFGAPRCHSGLLCRDPAYAWPPTR